MLFLFNVQLRNKYDDDDDDFHHPCTQCSAQKNFHAAIISRLATNVKCTKDMI